MSQHQVLVCLNVYLSWKELLGHYDQPFTNLHFNFHDDDGDDDDDDDGGDGDDDYDGGDGDNDDGGDDGDLEKYDDS